MALDTLFQLLQRVLHGEVTLDVLLDGIDEAQDQTPASLMSLQREVEALNTRGEMPPDAYMALIDRLEHAIRTQTGKVTVQRAPVGQHAGGPAADQRMVTTPPRPTNRLSPGGEIVLEPGSVINDRFVLEERLGAGGFGVVFKARDLPRVEAHDRDPYVAIKFINPDSGIRNSPDFPDFLMAFEREARRHMSLAHPNILNVHDYVRNPDGLAFLVMELLRGEPLDRLIRRHSQGLPLKEAWPLIKGAGEGLKHAHEQGIIHSDLKPANVFAVGASKAKVLDFGIARVMSVSAAVVQDETRYDTRKIRGMSPAYASPEILLGKDPSPSDDVYALACVAYELISGRHPLGNHASEELPAINAAHAGLKIERPPGMGRLQYKALVHALEFKHKARTPSVKAFLEEFEGRAHVKQRAKRRLLLTAAASVGVVAMLGLGILWYLRDTPDEQLAKWLADQAAVRFENQAGMSFNEWKQEGGKVDAETIEVLLEQGNDYLDQARKSFDPNLLSEGVSSAHGAFNSVLDMNPENRDAVNGIVEIVHQYESEAERRFDNGDFIGTSELAGYANKIDPNRESLKDFIEEANSKLQPAPE
jgi:eukaryotic-like serine/threonine-protein kinase